MEEVIDFKLLPFYQCQFSTHKTTFGYYSTAINTIASNSLSLDNYRDTFTNVNNCKTVDPQEVHLRSLQYSGWEGEGL